MKQEKESGLGLNPPNQSPSLISICGKTKKSRRADPGPSQGHCIIKRKGTFLLGVKPAAEFPSAHFSSTHGICPTRDPTLSQRPGPERLPEECGIRQVTLAPRRYKKNRTGHRHVKTPEPCKASLL